MDFETVKWRKASRSSANGGNCVEIASTGSVVLVRDSKNPAGGHLSFPVDVFRAFVNDIRSGRDAG